MIKGLRRSLKGEKRTSSSSSTTAPSSPGGGFQKNKIATTPPKKIIKAKYDYNSQGPGELGFQKGDFLYVVGNENDPDWYEACDPPSNLRGMVPVSYFDVVSRNDAIQTVPLTAVNPGTGDDHLLHQQQLQTQNQQYIENTGRLSQSSKQSPLYGIVLYDFAAERPDELQARKDESIIVIAQSNEEWFVAKPIGRLGGPGLIPISFVQIRDLASDKPVDNVEEAIRSAGVPRVEEWKRMAAEYKASSIPLGRFEDEHQQQVAQQMQRLAVNETAYPDQPSEQVSTENVVGPMVVSASVDRYAFDGGRYWYLVVAELSNGRYRNLCRYYQDFYDFQIKLLDEFPDEAGRTGHQRSLPFMPGPLTYVNDSISSQRRANLDDYVRNLIGMPSYISQSPTVQHLFALRAGDIETPHYTSTMPQPPAAAAAAAAGHDGTVSEQVLYNDQFASTNDTTTTPASSSTTNPAESFDTAATDYDYSHHQPKPSMSSLQSQSQQQQQQQQQHGRVGSEATVTDTYSQSHSRDGSTFSGQVGHSHSHSQTQHFQPQHQHQDQDQSQGQNHESSYSYDEEPQQQPSGPASYHQPQGSITSLNNKPESVSGSPGKSDSFIKVKVFHDDDLIAIRVPASVTFANLSSRIAERLGLEQVTLLHKDESSGDMDQMTDDIEFMQALNGRNKLVLYAK